MNFADKVKRLTPTESGTKEEFKTSVEHIINPFDAKHDNIIPTLGLLRKSHSANCLVDNLDTKTHSDLSNDGRSELADQ